MVKAARDSNLPDRPMRDRVAEAHAKGAAEAKVVAAVERVYANIQAAHDAMVEAGRSEPKPQEVENGAAAMERGVTKAELKALVEHAGPDRSLVVALDVLTRLSARGVPVSHALTEVRSKLDARATDTQLKALVGATGAVGARIP